MMLPLSRFTVSTEILRLNVSPLLLQTHLWLLWPMNLHESLAYKMMKFPPEDTFFLNMISYKYILLTHLLMLEQILVLYFVVCFLDAIFSVQSSPGFTKGNDDGVPAKGCITSIDLHVKMFDFAAVINIFTSWYSMAFY